MGSVGSNPTVSAIFPVDPNLRVGEALTSVAQHPAAEPALRSSRHITVIRRGELR